MAPTSNFVDGTNCSCMERNVSSFDLLVTGMHPKYTQSEKNDLEICFCLMFRFSSISTLIHFINRTNCSCMERNVSSFDLLVTGMHPKYTQSETNDLEICFW